MSATSGYIDIGYIDFTSRTFGVRHFAGPGRTARLVGGAMTPFMVVIVAMLAVAFWRHVAAVMLVGILILTLLGLVYLVYVVQGVHTGMPASLGLPAGLG